MKHLSLNTQEKFTEFISDMKVKINFSGKSLNSFWLILRHKIHYSVINNGNSHTIINHILMQNGIYDDCWYKKKQCFINTEIAKRRLLNKIQPRFNLLHQKTQDQLHIKLNFYFYAKIYIE